MEKRIPYILRVLCRWIPGLKLDEGKQPGPSPVLPVSFEKGQVVWQLFMDMPEDFDIIDLPWDDSSIVEMEGGNYILPLLKFTNSVEEYESSDPDDTFQIFAAKVPAGNYAFGKTFEKDGYLLSLSGLPLWVNEEAGKQLHDYFGTPEEGGWIPEIVKYLAVLPTFQEATELLPFTVNIKETWDSFLKPVPFERSQFIPYDPNKGEEQEIDIIYLNTYFNTKITPQLDRLTYGSEYAPFPGSFGAPLIFAASRPGGQGSPVVMAQKVPAGCQVEGYTFTKECYALLAVDPQTSDQTPIYLDNNYAEAFSEFTHQTISAGWQKLDPWIDQLHFDEMLCVTQVEQQDLWRAYISKEPFANNIRDYKEYIDDGSDSD